MQVYLFHTTGEQADVEQGMVAELRRVVTEHGIRASNSHTFLLEPGDQPEQLTVALKGVPAEVTGREEDREEVTGSVMLKQDNTEVGDGVNRTDAAVNKVPQEWVLQLDNKLPFLYLQVDFSCKLF